MVPNVCLILPKIMPPPPLSSFLSVSVLCTERGGLQCGSCVALSPDLGCGWCQERAVCATRSQCGTGPWLPTGSSCPLETTANLVLVLGLFLTVVGIIVLVALILLLSERLALSTCPLGQYSRARRDAMVKPSLLPPSSPGLERYPGWSTKLHHCGKSEPQTLRSQRRPFEYPSSCHKSQSRRRHRTEHSYCHSCATGGTSRLRKRSATSSRRKAAVMAALQALSSFSSTSETIYYPYSLRRRHTSPSPSLESPSSSCPSSPSASALYAVVNKHLLRRPRAPTPSASASRLSRLSYDILWTDHGLLAASSTFATALHATNSPQTAAAAKPQITDGKDVDGAEVTDMTTTTSSEEDPMSPATTGSTTSSSFSALPAPCTFYGEAPISCQTSLVPMAKNQFYLVVQINVNKDDDKQKDVDAEYYSHRQAVGLHQQQPHADESEDTDYGSILPQLPPPPPSLLIETHPDM